MRSRNAVVTFLGSLLLRVHAVAPPAPSVPLLRTRYVLRRFFHQIPEGRFAHRPRSLPCYFLLRFHPIHRHKSPLSNSLTKPKALIELRQKLSEQRSCLKSFIPAPHASKEQLH